MNLKNGHALEVLTSAAVNLDWSADWTSVDKTGATATTPDCDAGQITTATTTTIVSAPAASVYRVVKEVYLRNVGSSTNVVTVQRDVSGSNRVIGSWSLLPNEWVQYNDKDGWQAYTAQGVRKDYGLTGYTGRSQSFHKSGTAAEAVGYWYCTSKDGGFPGAWSVGASGINGRATDGTAAGDAGCVPFQNAASGGIYLTGASLWSSTNHPHLFFDCLWVNNGIVVTTTTAQAITTPTFPARDVNGSTNGEGLMIGLLFTAAATNAAVISGSTVSYTNSDGTAGRTATLENVVGMMIPATPVVGTIVWFKLQAGDKGVRSIQSITLGTSLVTGSVSLLVARWLPFISTTVVGVGANMQGVENPGVRLYDGTCLLHCYRASATTATVVGGSLTMMER